ncbi:unnamed protein product [Pylaiella littoralis]
MTNTAITTRSINVRFQGASRDVNLPTPVTLASLQAAIASTFEVDLPARSGPDDDEPKDSDLLFTYKGPEGDNIVFDKDSELSLALRLCPSSLKISAAGKEKPTDKPDPELKLYQTAARNLRECHGVPSMTPARLTKTLVFLKLGPRRLVKQGLAPEALLARATAETKNGLPLGDGDDVDEDNNDDLIESVAASVEPMMNVDDKKEWKDGFAPEESSAATPAETSACFGINNDNNAVHADDTSKNDDAAPAAAAAAATPSAKKDVLHEAFVAGGIQLRPREVRPLLVALGVRPGRLVRFGYVDGRCLLSAKLGAEKRANNRNGHQCMARGGAAAAGAPGAGGKRGPRGGLTMTVHHLLHPRPVVPVNGSAARGRGGRGGGGRPSGRPDANHPSARRGAHPHPHPNPRAHGCGNGKGGAGVRNAPPPEMVKTGHCGGGCGGGRQLQHGCESG